MGATLTDGLFVDWSQLGFFYWEVLLDFLEEVCEGGWGGRFEDMGACFGELVFCGEGCFEGFADFFDHFGEIGWLLWGDLGLDAVLDSGRSFAKLVLNDGEIGKS